MEGIASPSALAWRDPTPILRPRSIGIVGASPTARWVQIFLEQIPQAGFRGPLWPINPSYATIGDVPCYRSVRDTPEVPEHLIMHVATERTLPALEEAAAAGVKSATIYATGWAEADDAGKAREAALREFVERTGLRICGPNCLGFISVREGVVAYPLRVLEWLKPGGIGAVFQSGALLYPFVRAAGERGAGFSYLVSCGNEVGADAADYMRFLVDDPQTKAIALLLEGVRAPDKFRRALELALAAGKPVAVMKVGRSDRAQISTLTHTGALAGSTRVFDALCRRYGVAVCDTLEQLIETSRLFAVARRPAGDRAAVLVFSGSLRSHMLDIAPGAGIELAQPAAATVAKCQAVAPMDLRIANPLDCGVVQATQPKYMELAKLLVDDPGVDLLLVQEHAPDQKRNRDPALLKAVAASTSKPVMVLSETAYSRTPYTEEFAAKADVPFLQGIDRGFKAVGSLIEHARALRRREQPSATAAWVPQRRDLDLGPGLHGLWAIGDLLARHDIHVVPRLMARTAEEAVAAAGTLGYPVALKIESGDIAHKSDVGGVRLDLRDATAVRRAWAAMQEEVVRHRPAARIAGALVTRMAGAGVEMSVGVQRDPQFGLTVMAGLGGVWIEVLDDVSLRLLPIDDAEARAMIGELKGAVLLNGFRGSPPCDVAALAQAMVALTRFASEHAERLVSVEINPLIVHERGATAVDARLLLD